MNDNVEYYFAYGSNLDPEQMADRLPDTEAIGPARLDGYRLDFGGHSPHWDGAPATVMEAEEKSVPGYVYLLTPEAFAILDSYEGHPVRYERRTKSVTLEDGLRVKAAVYVKDLEQPGPPPPDEYYDKLYSAYERLGFDTDELTAAKKRARGR